MKKIDLPLWSDTLFCFGALSLFLVCLFRYFRVRLFLSMLLALFIAFTFSVFFFYFNHRRRQKKYLVGQDKEEKEKLMLHLALLNDEVTEKFLLPFTDGGKCFFLFTMQPLSADTIASKIKQNADCDFKIWCNELSSEAQKLCRDFEIAVLDGSGVYALLKEKNALPDKYIGGERKVKSASEKVRSAFKKSNGHAFFSGGATLLFLSLFSFYPIYYLIVGTFLLLISVYLRLFAKS